MESLPPSEGDKKRLMDAIAEAEKASSGEIRVHFENHCQGEVLDRAAEVFAKLKMHKTALRNGVLFYVAIKDHKFAIIGDKGINKLVSDDFWDKIKNHMLSFFKKSEFIRGLCDGILMAGDQLKKHFPYKDNDQNELPDDISYDKN